MAEGNNVSSPAPRSGKRNPKAHPVAIVFTVICTIAFLVVTWLFIARGMLLGDAVFGWLVSGILMLSGIGHVFDTEEPLRFRNKPKSAAQVQA